MAELGDFLSFGSYDTGDSVGKSEGDLCVPEHDVLVEYMDFDYIEKCTDKAMLRGILKKLKSGKEGYYPALEKCCEEKLLSLLPSEVVAQVKRLQQKVTFDERNEAQMELDNWANKIKDFDQALSASHREDIERAKLLDREAALSNLQTTGTAGISAHKYTANGAISDENSERHNNMEQMSINEGRDNGKISAIMKRYNDKDGRLYNEDNKMTDNNSSAKSSEGNPANRSTMVPTVTTRPIRRPPIRNKKGNQDQEKMNTLGEKKSLLEKKSKKDIQVVGDNVDLDPRIIDLTKLKMKDLDLTNKKKVFYVKDLRSKREKLCTSLLSPVDAFYRSNREKEKGNECFRAKEYDSAMLHYTNAIAYLPMTIHLIKKDCDATKSCDKSNEKDTLSLYKSITGKDSIQLEFFVVEMSTSASKSLLERNQFAVFFANRAMVHLKLENFATAEEDCNIALLLDSEYIKAIWRRGMTRYRRGKYSQAITDLESAKAKCSDAKLKKEIDSLLEICQQKYDEIEKPVSSSSTIGTSISSTIGKNESESNDNKEKGKLSRISIIEEDSSDEDTEGSDDEVEIPIKVLKDNEESKKEENVKGGMRRLTIIEDDEED